MDAGMAFWNMFLGFCIISIMAALYGAYRRDQIHNMNITLNDRMPPQQPTPPQKIDVHVHVDFPELPTGDEIGAGIVRQIQAAAQKQLTAQGHQVDWHVVRDEQERLPGKVQPRLGNKRQEIVRR